MFKHINLFITTLVFLTISIVYIFYPKISLSSDILGDWLSTTSMPNTSNTGSHYSFIYTDKLYSIGGANTSTFANGIYSDIALNGTVSNWTNINSQPNVLWHSGATYNNNVYLLGGANSSIVNISDVKLGMIDSGGNITSWSSTTSLPFSLSLGAAVTVGNRVYYAGGSINGENSSNAKSEIWKSDINPTDGTLGAWTLAGNLPQPMLGFGMVEHNGYLIILGGLTTGNIYLSDVKKTLIDSITGSIGSWSSLPSLPDPVYRAGVTKSDNLIVSAGGYHISPSFTLMDKVNFAEVNLSGDISSWTESGFTLPQPTCCFSLSSWDKFIYMIGGWTGSYTNSVYMSKIESSATPTPSPSPSPSPSPTPSPSPVPTATPMIPIINVPSLKQYSEPWQNNLYDHTLGKIKQWGCALTSAAMILQYHGHNIMPDVLNTWLNSQTDGYISNGLINWLAVSRYTRLNDSPSSPTLEYKRLSPTTLNLDGELANSRPVVLKESGHFVVGTGKLSSGIYSINDPGYASRTDLSSYGNSYLAINSYTPTHSDLSYMMFTADSDIVLELIDSNGNIVPTINYIENPISDIDDPDNKSGEPLSVLLYEKPNLGKYILKINGGAGDYNLDTYLYTTNGTVTKKSFPGTLSGSSTNIYDVTFDTTQSVAVDTTPPAVPVNPIPTNNGYTNLQNFTFSWSPVSDTSTPVTYEWESSYNTNLKPDGSFTSRLAFHSLTSPSVYSPGTPNNTYHWHVRAIDSLNNKSAWSETWKVTVDNIKPTLPSNLSYSKTDGTVLGCNISTNVYTVIAKWSASNDLNFSHYEYRSFNPTTGWVWNAGNIGNVLSRTGSFTVGQGIYGFAVRTVDKAGNYSDWTSENLTNSCKVTYDTIPPSVPTGIYYEDTDNNKNVYCNEYTSTRHLDVYWDDNTEVDFDHYEYISYNSDGSTGPVRLFTDNYFNASWWTIPTEGTYGVQIMAVDKAGNKSEWFGGSQNVSNSCKYTADWTSPTGNWINPLNDSNISGFVNLNFEAFDTGSGIDSIKYSYKPNDGVSAFIDTGSTWNTTPLELSSYILRATVTDNVGNEMVSDLVINVVAIISNISSTTPSADSAVITWTTDKPTKSRVVYDTVRHDTLGLAPNYDYTFSTGTFDSSPKVTSHSVTITGLSAGTTYYYRTISEGSPVAIGIEREFRTLTIAGAPSSSGTSTNTVVVTPLFEVPTVFRTVFTNQEQQEEVLGTETEDEESPLPNPTSKPDVKGVDTTKWNVKNLIWILPIGGLLILFCIKLLLGKTRRNKQII